MQQSHTGGAVNQPKPGEAFRNFAAEERPSVREFYRQNHTHQTVEFVLRKKGEYLTLNRRTMRVRRRVLPDAAAVVTSAAGPLTL